jgi:hypothetical protein
MTENQQTRVFKAKYYKEQYTSRERPVKKVGNRVVHKKTASARITTNSAFDE